MHTFLAIDLMQLPQGIRYNENALRLGRFSNEAAPTQLLIDGYAIDENGDYKLDSNGDKILVHTDAVMNAWINPHSTVLESAIEYTKEQFEAEQQDSNSIWHIN